MIHEHINAHFAGSNSIDIRDQIIFKGIFFGPLAEVIFDGVNTKTCADMFVSITPIKRAMIQT